MSETKQAADSAPRNAQQAYRDIHKAMAYGVSAALEECQFEEAVRYADQMAEVEAKFTEAHVSGEVINGCISDSDLRPLADRFRFDRIHGCFVGGVLGDDPQHFKTTLMGV